MKRFLLDTSVVIDYLRRSDKEKTLFYQLADHQLFISMITHTEVFAGKSVWEDKEAHDTVVTVFSGLKIISLTEVISEFAGQIKAQHSKLSLADSIIAATAMKESIPLVTLNRKDFVRVDQLRLWEN